MSCQRLSCRKREREREREATRETESTIKKGGEQERETGREATFGYSLSRVSYSMSCQTKLKLQRERGNQRGWQPRRDREQGGENERESEREA